MTRTKTEFNILHAFHGDSILIKTFDTNLHEFVILIDGGTAQTFRYSLKEQLKDLSHINLLILTHIDSDHIAGLISFLKSSLINDIKIDEIWMNNPDLVEVSTGELISVRQGDNLRNLILEKKPGAKLSQISTKDKSINRSGIEFTILSPTLEIVNKLYEQWELLRLIDKKKNKKNISSNKRTYLQSLEELSTKPFSPDQNVSNDIFNASSISFILKCPDISLLLLADSRPEIISQSLRGLSYHEQNPLVVDFVKVSHHGSLNNTSQELLSLIVCNNYLISTNGGTADHIHPSRETIARIVYNSNRSDKLLKIYFNYNLIDLKNRIGDFINKIDLKHGNWSAESQNRF
ncbi:ComEC/Rec2 family competence protein [Pontibacter pamirensis]|uniref:ComEC/Rec2 family competence protein n=1 Tax=Pontibacter pamirensis TaxID=2562824 RepID=UPI0013898EA3|nr:MBL fold metallo-hydrolase [Pontibacter pamirensis]